MRLFTIGAIVTAFAASATAAPRQSSPSAQRVSSPQSTSQLRAGLRALIAAAPTNTPQGGSASQGADHAAARAILVVCTKDTPAAQRAAICRDASPQ